MDLKVFQMADEAEDGRWFEMDETTRIKVRSDDSETYQKVLRGILDSYPNFRKLPRKTQEKIMAKAVGMGLIVDWDGLYEDGVKIEYSEAEAIRLCTEYPTFRRYVTELAATVGNFKQTAEQD